MQTLLKSLLAVAALAVAWHVGRARHVAHHGDTGVPGGTGVSPVKYTDGLPVPATLPGVRVRVQRSAVTGQPAAVSDQRSAVSGQPSAVSGQPSAVSRQRSAIGHRPSAIDRQPVAGSTLPPPSANRPVRAGGQFRGMAIQLYGGPGVVRRYRRLIPEIADLGADTVLFVVHGWQEHAGTLDLHVDPHKTADARDVGELCDLAKAHGLRTILMPIVLLTHPRNNEWRGKIVPADRDWDTWFRRYVQFIVHFAKTAERHRVDVLMIGSELIKTEMYTDRWRKVIEEVRQHYRGKLGYSSNWDHYQTDKVGFWPLLDYVGMTSYYELADGGKAPSIEEIDANWVKIKKEIKTFQKEVGKPIIFTEVGWCSQEGAAHEGWNYYANQNATQAGQKEQAILYASFLNAWSDEPCVGGIIWWEWDTSEGGKNDHGYTPRGKPAETLLRHWFAGKPGPEIADELRANRQ